MKKKESTIELSPHSMRQMMNFYRELGEHNNKEWFDAHREWYLETKATYRTLAGELIAALSEVDEDLRGLSVDDCTYRIFRDVRFSKDKRPYKSWAGIFIAKGTKRGPHIGYYLHIEPSTSKFFLCQGTYWCDAKVLKSIREDIMLSGDKLEAAIRKAEGYELDWSNALKKVPAQWPADSPYADYFRLKVFAMTKSVDEDYFTTEGLVQRLTRDFSLTTDFSHFINRAVDYAIEEWGYK